MNVFMNGHLTKAKMVDLLFIVMIQRLPSSTLFPYTTLFRSRRTPCHRALAVRLDGPTRAPRAPVLRRAARAAARSEEHTSELQSLTNLVCRLLLEKKKSTKQSR